MSNEKGVLRSVVVPALLAMVCVGLLAFFLSGRGGKRPAPAEPEPARLAPVREAAPAPAPAPALEPARSDAATLASADAAAEAPPAPPAPTAAPDASAFTPEIKLHAQKLIPPTVLQAVEQGNLAHVRSLRDQLSARASEGLLAPSDLEALDLVVECMENATDAREEARDLLQFGSATILNEALKAACNQ